MTNQQTFLITGGTSGIGLGLALRHAAAGHRVVVAGRRPEALADVAAAHPGLGTLLLDVTDPASVAAAAKTFAEEFGALDVLVNNAGIMVAEDLTDPAHVATAEATIATNLLGPIRVTAAFLPLMTGRDDATIVSVSSGLAFVPLKLTPTYSATKAAIHSWTEALRMQLADAGIRVVELVPPMVATDLMPGQAADPRSMPFEEFLDEVMGLWDAGTDEILVERVKPLRHAVENGSYEQVRTALAAH